MKKICKNCKHWVKSESMNLLTKEYQGICIVETFTIKPEGDDSCPLWKQKTKHIITFKNNKKENLRCKVIIL